MPDMLHDIEPKEPATTYTKTDETIAWIKGNLKAMADAHRNLAAKVERMELELSRIRNIAESAKNMAFAHNHLPNGLAVTGYSGPPWETDPTPPAAPEPDGDSRVDQIRAGVQRYLDEGTPISYTESPAARPVDNRIGPNFGKELPAPEPEDDANLCEVCGRTTMYGTRHYTCGKYALRMEREIAAIRAAPADRAVVVTDAMVDILADRLARKFGPASYALRHVDNQTIHQGYRPFARNSLVAALRVAERGEPRRKVSIGNGMDDKPDGGY
jgi:hypothetical protein